MCGWPRPPSPQSVGAGDDFFSADEFSERDQAIRQQFRVLDEFRGSFHSVQSYLHCSDLLDERFVRVDA